MCSCQRTHRIFTNEGFSSPIRFASVKPFLFIKVVGVTGFEPVTLRLSSACSNQLSYTPMPITDMSWWS
jgi:hypothetical protein